MTTIGVLGPVRALRDGVPIDLGAPRQRAVLARLVAGGGHVVSVDQLVEDLWSGDPPPRAQAALQVYVSNLRRALEPDRPPRHPARILVTAAPGYALRLPTPQVDAWRFEAALRAATRAAETPPQAAVADLDEALAGWDGCLPYAEFVGEPWADRESDRLGRLRLTAVEQRAKLLLDVDRADEVVLDLDPLVRDHPLREQAAMLLAVALYRLGRQADALDVVRAARAALSEQMGIDPGPELRSLETDLLRQDPRLGPSAARTARPVAAAGQAEPPPAGGQRPTAAPPPVGRAVELARMRAAADRVTGAGLGFCWVGADAGGGKSTLARHLAGGLAADGWITATGTCPQVEGAPPAWAWHEVVTAARTRFPLDEAEAAGLRLLVDLGTVTAAGAGRYDEFHLRQALGAYLCRLAGHGPLLVVIEDLHRADGETLRVLRHLAVTLADAPVLVVATFRPDEVTEDVVAARAALTGVPAVELHLDGLDDGAVAELLRRHGVDTTDTELLRTVRDRSAGNPLFTIELARLIAAEGPGSALDGIPAALGHVLARRLARLPAAARTVLRHAAVLGPDAEVDILVAVDGGPEEPVLDGLEAGVTAGLLVEPEPGRIRFAHALLRDALYHSVPLLRRTRMHHRILTVLRAQRADEVAALGRHALAALTPATAGDAIGHLAAAARRAGDLGAPREAAVLWAGALRAADLAPAAARTRLDLLCQRATASALAGDVLTARAARADAVRLATGFDDPQAVHSALTCFDAPVTWTIRPDRAVDGPLVRLLEQELSRVGGDEPALRSRLLSTLAFEIEGADLRRADEVTRECLALARRQDDPAVLCRALNARYFVTVAPAYRAELPDVGRELLAVAEAAGLTAYQCEAHHILYQAALAEADFDRARYHVDRAIEEATTGQLGLILAVMGWFTGLRALFAGDLDEASRRYAEVSERMVRVGGPNAAAMGLMGRFTVLSTVGRGHEVLGELRQVHARVPDDAHDVLAHALLSAGDRAAARAVWRPQTPIRPDYLWLYWMTLRGQVAARLGDRPAARRCYQELLPWAGRFAGLECGSISLGPVDQTLAELADTLGDPAAAAHRAAGLRLARRVGAVPWSDESASVPAAVR
ncbi:BTAD domain-containing putative transcriptional regulator [Micromonospora fluostatini]